MAMDGLTFRYFPHPFSDYFNTQPAIRFRHLQCLRHYTGCRHAAKKGTFGGITIYIKLSVKVNVATPLYLQDLLHPYMSSRSTRMSKPNIKLLAIPYFDLRIHTFKAQLDKSFSYQAPQLWNALPFKVRTAPSCECFKERLKHWGVF